MRAAESSTAELDAALLAEEMVPVQTVELTQTREVDAGGGSLRGGPAGKPPIRVTVPAPADGWGQLLLATDESGVMTWNFAPAAAMSPSLRQQGHRTWCRGDGALVHFSSSVGCGDRHRQLGRFGVRILAAALSWIDWHHGHGADPTDGGSDHERGAACGSEYPARCGRPRGACALAASRSALSDDGGRKRPVHLPARRARRRRLDRGYRLPDRPRARGDEATGTLAAPTHGGAALLLDRGAYVFGGAGPPVYDLVQEYDPTSGQTRVAGHLPSPRADLAAAAVGSQVVVAAGFDGVGPLDTVLATTDGRHFRLLAHLLLAVRYPAVAVVGRSVYLFGGLESGGEYTGTFSRSVQRVNLVTGRASIVGQLPTSYAHAMATVRDGQVFVLGGSTPAAASNAILRFNPATGRVSRAGTLPEHVADGGVATIGDATYILGGINGAPLTTVCVVRIG